MKYRSIKLMAFPTALAAVAIPLSLVPSNSNNAKPEINKATKNSATLNDQTSTGIFNVKDGVLYGLKEGTTKQDLLDNMKDNTLVLPECKTIAEGAFRDTILNDAPFGTTITIPSTTTSIGNFAFYGNTAASVTWEGTPTCTTIGKAAFGRCKSITSFTLPASTTTIGADAFMGCSSLATIECKMSSCPTLGNKSVFRGTKASGSLTYLTDSNAESIWMNFVDSGLNSSWTQNDSSGTVISKPKTIPTDYLTYDTVNDNEGNATLTITGVNTLVCDITKFNKLVIPATINGVNVTQIGSSAFRDNQTLKTVDLSNASNLTTINESAFEHCKNLTTVSIHTALTKIGVEAFYKCYNLTTFTIPEGSNLAIIDKRAFAAANDATSTTYSQLSTFAFQNTKLTTIGYRSFMNSGLTTISMPSSSIKLFNGQAFYGCKNLISVDMSQTQLTDPKPTEREAHFGKCTSLTTITLPNNIKFIPANEFASCTSLTSITIPSTVGTITAGAFTGCDALTSVTFENSSNSFTVKDDSTTISSKYLPTSPKLNADHLRSGYSFAVNPLTFTYEYLNVDTEYASTFTIPFSSTSTDITWESSDESVATVSNGVVTVPQGASGTTTITATITGTGTSSTFTVNALVHNSGLIYEATSTTGEASVKENTSAHPTGEVTVAAVWNSRFVTTIPQNGFGSSDETPLYSGSVYNIPGTIKYAGYATFWRNYTIQNINFQEPCDIAWEWNSGHAWNGNASLKSVTFPEGMTSFLGNHHFWGDTNLQYVKMPSTMQVIGGMWFGDAQWGVGSGNFILDLTALSHVPDLWWNEWGKPPAENPQTLRIIVKNQEMLEKFQAHSSWSAFTGMYEIGS